MFMGAVRRRVRRPHRLLRLSGARPRWSVPGSGRATTRWSAFEPGPAIGANRLRKPAGAAGWSATRSLRPGARPPTRPAGVGGASKVGQQAEGGGGALATRRRSRDGRPPPGRHATDHRRRGPEREQARRRRPAPRNAKAAPRARAPPGAGRSPTRRRRALRLVTPGHSPSRRRSRPRLGRRPDLKTSACRCRA